MTLLPLTTNTYGNTDDSGSFNSYWCFITDKPDSPSWGLILWVILGFYLWVWISILLIIYMFLRIFKVFSLNIALQLSEEFNSAIKSLFFYPIFIIFCWTFTSITDIYAANSISTSFNNEYFLAIIGTILPASQGFVNSIIFVLNNKIVIDEWKSLIRMKNTIDETALLTNKLNARESYFDGCNQSTITDNNDSNDENSDSISISMSQFNSQFKS